MKISKILIVILIVQIFVLTLMIIQLKTNTLIPFLIVKSDSMNPVLKKGQIIRITNNFDKNADLINEIVVFYNPFERNVYVHRIIGKENDFFITKGDNNDFVDKFRPNMSFVLGKTL